MNVCVRRSRSVANSVLAAATLWVQGHANVWLANGARKPLSSFFVSVAATGERKNAVDQEALAPVRMRQAALREAHAIECLKVMKTPASLGRLRRSVLIKKVSKGRWAIHHPQGSTR